MTNDNAGNTTAARYFDDERFHRSFTLPPDASRPAEFKVTYADFGHHNDEHIMLFCGPLMGSRYLLTTKDKLAQQHGVRIIAADRPGFGGTTDVPPADRVRVWLEIVEALLKHLSIKHVSIVGYSGGAIYAMNVLLHMRHILHPTHPYVALCTPWIHPSHSGVSTLKIAGLLPNGLVGSFDRLLQAVNSMGPAFQFSNVLSGLIPSFSRGTDPLPPGVDAEAIAVEESLHKELLRRVTNEDIRGISQDALLLLKRDEYPGCWGTWGDWDKLVPLLAQAEKERRSADSPTAPPLRVHVFFAETDMMIGTTVARNWLDNCWKPEQRGDAIEYSSEVIPKTNHDNILDLKYGVVERILRDMTG
ncbi:Alpha/Beta hydrolase protein [Hypomontagnella monticulosa]|nr:Alpha/Beta hydrolase protein [Hypomontagnella monticulosa]